MQQATTGGNDIKSLQKDALRQTYALIAQNQAERNQTLQYLDEEIELTRESQQYSFLDKLASVVTLGLYSMIKEVHDKWEIEALQEEKKEIRTERLEDLKQLKEMRNALKDASDRAYSGNKWYIPEDRFNNLENLIKSSKMLDNQTRAGLTNYLDVMKDIEKNRIQERNHSKILEKANENILIGNTGTGYDSYAEKRLNGLKDLAKDMLKTKGLSDEDRKFCEKLTNSSNDFTSLKEKLQKPNAFKKFDDLKKAVDGLQEKQTVEQEQIAKLQKDLKKAQTPPSQTNDSDRNTINTTNRDKTNDRKEDEIVDHENIDILSSEFDEDHAADLNETLQFQQEQKTPKVQQPEAQPAKRQQKITELFKATQQSQTLPITAPKQSLGDLKEYTREKMAKTTTTPNITRNQSLPNITKLIDGKQHQKDSEGFDDLLPTMVSTKTIKSNVQQGGDNPNLQKQRL